MILKIFIIPVRTPYVVLYTKSMLADALYL